MTAATGGELQIVARFPQGDVVISQFKEIENRQTPDTNAWREIERAVKSILGRFSSRS